VKFQTTATMKGALMKKRIVLVVIGLWLLGPALAVAAMIEISTLDHTTPKTEQIRASAQELDGSLVRAKDMISHIRQEYTLAGCPAVWKSDQCISLGHVLEQVMERMAPSGASGSVTVQNSTFYDNSVRK
jgi:hypothetical protein